VHVGRGAQAHPTPPAASVPARVEWPAMTPTKPRRAWSCGGGEAQIC
jgi:hypothetical protein